jgi:hypothetical protein
MELFPASNQWGALIAALWLANTVFRWWTTKKQNQRASDKLAETLENKMIQEKSVQYAKELDDCLVLMIELAKDIKEGKDIGALVSENLPNLIQAIGGMEQIKGELEANKEVVYSTAGFRMGELVGALVK